MKKMIYAAALTAFVASPAIAQQNAADNALTSDQIAWDITEGLTTEVGQRMPGTEAEARARVWALKKLKSLGLKNVREENFMMPTWVRGEETAEIVSPYPQKMVIAALGNSGATGENGLEAEVVYFASFADLAAADASRVKGKIVFIDHHMKPAQDGSSYGFAGPGRWFGPNVAAKKGAAAIAIRSIGTDRHRNPHTGNTNFEEGVTPIPSGALTNPDADNLVRMVKRGKTVKMRLKLTPRNIGQQKSGNVIAEIPGSDPSLPIIVVACHLDSWDLAPSAFDDAAGCGIVTAAAIHATKSKQPLRTIRVLWAGAEEVGLWGGKAYGEKYKNAPHALAMESDFGADRVWRIEFKTGAGRDALKKQLGQAVARFGVSIGQQPASGGADIQGIIAAQEPMIIDLQQDGSRYFDLHHTPDDTLDKIDKAQLRQNVAVWTTVLQITANYKGKLKP